MSISKLLKIGIWLSKPIKYFCRRHTENNCVVGTIEILNKMASLWCSRTLRRIISDLSSCHDIRLLSGCQAQLELVFREVAATEVLFDNDVNITAAFNLVREALSIVQNEIEQLVGRPHSPQRYSVCLSEQLDVE